MPFDEKLADKIREQLAAIPKLKIEEKRMFSGIAFMVNGKMCINVSHDNLMCRFDPARYDELANRNGFMEMVMRGKLMKGYCYVTPDGFAAKKDFQFWINLCVEFNKVAKSSKKKKGG